MGFGRKLEAPQEMALARVIFPSLYLEGVFLLAWDEEGECSASLPAPCLNPPGMERSTSAPGGISPPGWVSKYLL